MLAGTLVECAAPVPWRHLAILKRRLMKRSHWFTFSVLALAVLSVEPALVAAERVRVDVGAEDGRRDTGTPYWQTWKVKQGGEATSRNFGDVTVTLRAIEDAVDGLDTFLTKTGIDTGATMATDGVASATGDGGIEIELRGLTAGPHTFVTYHNSIRDEPPSRLTVSCRGVKVGEGSDEHVAVQPSQQVSHNDDAASAFFSFVAEADKPVVIRILANEGGARRVAVLNGFEIDGDDPKRTARKPTPAHDDEHVDGDAGVVQLQWKPAAGAVRHEVYFASDRDAPACAARVAQAGRDDAAFHGSVTAPRATIDITDNDSLLHYCWRVDEVDESGSVTRGEVWRFRVRHLAFPGAEGYGRHARGGRGGRVIAVTNLNDAGPGSLRAAVEAEGPRTVVFHVSGMITLKSKLVMTRDNSNITIAGQTAPGSPAKGICIRNWTFGTVGARDVIIRHVRLRLGDLAGKTMDGMGLASADHAIIDHCSISWTIDEAFSSRGAGNITLQRCLISEALNVANHKKYGAGKGHGFAASISGDVGSFHHNLLAHCAGRNWSLAGGINQANRHAGRLDIRNNVVYNWRHRTTDGGAMQVNFVNNYYKSGPASKVETYLNPHFENPGFGPQQYYVEGNIMEGVAGPEGPTGPFEGMRVRGKQDAPVTVAKPFFEHHVITHTAKQAYENVLADVGCNVPMLDEHDKRVIRETRAGNATYKGSRTGLPGIPDSQRDVGGWEDYPEVHRPKDWDTDGDGMPNEWENRKGLDPSNPRDGNADPDGDGFTNLEDYLNWLAAGSPSTRNND